MNQVMDPVSYYITLDEFVSEMSKQENSYLLTSFGLREFVLRHGGFAKRKSIIVFQQTD